jgi:NAD(P)-dependent dehydrogenase (short-subunit alcohol dehydrogenase family)
MQIPDNVIDDVRKRLRRAAGQVQAVERMLSEGRECREVVIQISAATKALEQAGFKLVAAGLTYCVERPDEAEADGYSLDDVERMAKEVLDQHERVDILVNNAGRSIRRSISRSYDRIHDYQRTMQVNYFGPVKLILKLLPVMREQGRGHIVNISSIGLQTNTPRFAAYLASKAALDAFSRSIGPEIIDDGVHLTTVYMPLVRTPMIAPTKIYDRFPTLSPEEAGEMICDAIRKRPKRMGTALGNLGQLTYAIAPGAQDLVVNRAYKLFPEGGGEKRSEEIEDQPAEPTAEQRAFARATRGVHW